MNSKKFEISSLVPLIAALFLAMGTGILLRLAFWLTPNVSLIITLGLFVIIYPFTRMGNAPTTRSRFLYSFLPLLLLGFWVYFIAEFGMFDWSSILYHFSTGIGGSDVVMNYLARTIKPISAIAYICIGLLLLKNRLGWVSRFDKLLAVAILAINPAVATAGIDLVSGKAAEANDTLLKNYVKPSVNLANGRRPKNFIHVFLESTERTYFNEAVFGPIMQPLAQMEKTGFTAHNIIQAHDTGWTAAGLSSSLCGVPLSSVGLGTGNYFDIYAKFMPNATCLGDVLESHDYQLSILLGADKTFAATDKLFGDHGYQTVIGFEQLLEMYPDDAKSILQDGRESFGSHDDVVFKASYDLLRKGQASGKPFGISILTMGGHAPLGNLSSSCKGRKELEMTNSPSPAAIYCTNLLLQEFMEKAGAEGLLKDTIVVVQSDHLSMKNEVYSSLISQKRENLFFMFGDGISAKIEERSAMMPDVYPTLLEALGFELANHRAGVGVSLFGEQKNLIEQIGIGGVNSIIKYDNALRYKLWEPAEQKLSSQN